MPNLKIQLWPPIIATSLGYIPTMLRSIYKHAMHLNPRCAVCTSVSPLV